MNVVLSLMEFVWRGGGAVVLGWWGLHLQPNYSVEVVLRCVVVGVVTRIWLRQVF